MENLEDVSGCFWSGGHLMFIETLAFAASHAEVWMVAASDDGDDEGGVRRSGLRC